MAFKQDIFVDIAKGFAILSGPSYRPLVLVTGTVARDAQIVAQPSDLLTFGYTADDDAYKIVSAMTSQIPTVAEIMVVQKLDATDYDAALTALKIIRNDWWGILIDSHTEADLNDVGDWANANKKMFVGDINDTTAGDGRNVFRESYGIYDKLDTTGTQAISSEPLPFIGATVAGITAGTYHINIADDGNATNDLSIVVAGGEDWDDLAALIQVAYRAATAALETVVIVDGTILTSSITTGDDSAVLITDGTGDDGGLLAIIDTLSNYLTTIESPENGATKWPAASLMARKLGKEPYKTWKWKQLGGLTAVDYNLTQLNEIRDNNTWTVTSQAGATFTNEGNCTSGDFIDTVYQIDDIESQITLAILQLFLSNESVPLDDTGIPQIENVIRGVLDAQGAKGVIAALTPTSPDSDKAKSDSGVYMYTVSIPKRADISTIDLAARKLPNVKFTYVIAGAIHVVDVDGTLTV